MSSPGKWKQFTKEEIASWPENHKQCRLCGEVKPFSQFHKNKQTLLGINTECKTCRLPKSKQQWSTKDTITKIYDRTKWRAAKKGREFTISPSDIHVPEFCPILGVRLVEGDTEAAPSIDRLDSTKGYTPDNIHIISNKANRIKNSATVEELQAIVDWMSDLV